MSAGAASTPRDSAVPVRTTRFGRLETVEVRPDALLAFPSGLPGFEDQTSFALIDDPRHHPFRWLQSLADSAVRFLVIEAGLVASGGRLELGGADLDALRLRPDERPEVL